MDVSVFSSGVNSSEFPDRSIVASLLILAGAASAVFITGTQDVWAAAVFPVAAGLALLVGRPSVRPGWVPLLLAIAFCLLALLAFLPHTFWPVAPWRTALSQSGLVPLADSISPQPWLGWFWWLMLVASCVVGAFLLSNPLEGRSLALFLHAVAVVVAVYAVLSIIAVQTGWKYPFAGGALFGFFPNRNHTATLLFVGAIVSFGLMQWQVTNGQRAAAVLAALCAAPALAGLLFFSTSRAGVVFLVLGLAMWACGAAQGRARRHVLAAAGILVAFLLLLFVAGGSTVRDRLAALWHSASAVPAQEGDGDVDFRQPIARDTARLIADFSLTGTGLGQFADVFPQYRKDSVRAAKVLHPESDWLMVAAETGIPSACVLAAAVLWFLLRCWRARTATDGPLRWTAASAVGAAVAHAAIDVPWHRFALGWFLLVVAMTSVPSSGLAIKRPALVRMVYSFLGLVLLAAGIFVAREKYEGRHPAPYRVEIFNRELQSLSAAKRWEDAESKAKELVQAFPLMYESYYWLTGFQRYFLDTEQGIADSVAAARLVEPVLPQVAVAQAVLWKDMDASREADAWSVAVRRAALVGTRDPTLALGYLQSGLASLKESPEAQAELLDGLGGDPLLIAGWFHNASPAAASAWVANLAAPESLLAQLPQNAQMAFLERWVTLPDAPRALAYMEARQTGAGQSIYWRPLASYYAAAGDKPRAVALVAQAAGVSLDSQGRGQGDLGAQLASLEQQGNTVAVRRLLQEVINSSRLDSAKLSVALAWYAAAGDWDSAWKAASRLASDPALRQ
ncbi:MAG: hypothetical protein RIR25_678 [Verrucomicrobiota bacterium]